MVFLLELVDSGPAILPLPLATGWDGFLNALPPAFVGAVLALFLAGPGRRWLRRLFGRGSGVSSRGRLAGSCESAECGLQEFAHEVETRLDAKLDRLERLLGMADSFLGGSAASSTDPDVPAEDRESAEGRESTAATESGLGSITADQRERVLVLAADGQSPEAISEAVGLIRGEVDLILRLYGRQLSRQD